jgi:hypothetical protein
LAALQIWHNPFIQPVLSTHAGSRPCWVLDADINMDLSSTLDRCRRASVDGRVENR